jgi:predicted transcriptional regulator
MRRGLYEKIGEVLWETKTRRFPKTRIATISGVNCNFMDYLIKEGFLSKGAPVKLTDKGTEFLLHFQALQKIVSQSEITRG